jgi:hypothetical protein
MTPSSASVNLRSLARLFHAGGTTSETAGGRNATGRSIAAWIWHATSSKSHPSPIMTSNAERLIAAPAKADAMRDSSSTSESASIVSANNPMASSSQKYFLSMVLQFGRRSSKRTLS